VPTPPAASARPRAVDVILDPRARVERRALPPAPRPEAARLRHDPVLLYDNGKLAEGAYPEVFPRLRERLAECGVARVIARREPIRGASGEALRERARALSATGAVAAVVALADVGVSPATALLAIALEAEGVPTVCLTADPGDALARAVASHQAEALGLVRLDLTSDAGAPAVRAAVDRAWPKILDALTRPDAGRATAAGRDSSTIQSPATAATRPSSGRGRWRARRWWSRCGGPTARSPVASRSSARSDNIEAP